MQNYDPKRIQQETVNHFIKSWNQLDESNVMAVSDFSDGRAFYETDGDDDDGMFPLAMEETRTYTAERLIKITGAFGKEEGLGLRGGPMILPNKGLIPD
jgi:hypothetical protein